MEYLFGIVSIFLCMLVVISSGESQNNIQAMGRSVLRLLACFLFLFGVGVACDYIDIPTKYYGFVKVDHQLSYALVIEVGALVLATLSRK